MVEFTLFTLEAWGLVVPIEEEKIKDKVISFEEL